MRYPSRRGGRTFCPCQVSSMANNLEKRILLTQHWPDVDWPDEFARRNDSDAQADPRTGTSTRSRSSLAFALVENLTRDSRTLVFRILRNSSIFSVQAKHRSAQRERSKLRSICSATSLRRRTAMPTLMPVTRPMHPLCSQPKPNAIEQTRTRPTADISSPVPH